jgi:hemerythrin
LEKKCPIFAFFCLPCYFYTRYGIETSLTMLKIKKLKVTNGVYRVDVEDANIRILCGCPADVVKHMKKRGLIEETEKNGVKYETGPNVILLSDVLMQHGSFSNLTEFPVLQMLYLQGMIVPNHPNNNGIKPVLVGSEEQVKSQMEYIYRGNYGLISKEEMTEAGISEEDVDWMMKVKLKFAFGKITPPENLLDSRILANDAVEIRNEVFIKRIAFNKFEISYLDESVSVDLNLAPEETYEAPYQLGYHHVKREYFAVVHSGEGDGWDINRPCMASVLLFQGRVYLIDAGPNILTTLNYLGISVNEIDGIFHTHAHDDHFAGLTTLIRTDRRFKYFATPLVRSAVSKKLCALMSIKEENFKEFFEIHDLQYDVWSNIQGLEVMPVYSPHPVETNMFFFRTLWNSEYKVYAHFADVVAFDVFEKMIGTGENDVPPHVFEKVKKTYLTHAHLKKIDVGGGMIHGKADDFREDRSDKIVLAHTHKPLTMKEREVGSSAAFGMVDVLIPANHNYNYLLEYSYKHLRFYFPTAPEHEINYLLNHPILQLNAGSMLLKKGEVCEYVYLLLTGSVIFNGAQIGPQHIFSAGSLIGFYSGFLGSPATETYWASSNVSVLQLPSASYNDFVARNNLYSELKTMEKHILFLEETWLFGEVVSFPILTNIAKNMPSFEAKRGEIFKLDGETRLFLIEEGKAELRAKGGVLIEELNKRDFFGTNIVLFEHMSDFEVHITQDSKIFTIPAELVVKIPVVYW